VDPFASGAAATKATTSKRKPAASSADALLAALPPIALVVGKGGVGKTTCAAALALHASRSQRTLVLSTDPAQALGLVLPDDVPDLEVRPLDAGARRDEFMSRWGEVIRAILDRGTYLDDADIGPLVDTALPGGDEIFAALALAGIFRDDAHERVVIDTAPTGHTLRLLDLPGTFRALVNLLDAMQAKHRYMVRTLTRTYKRDAADAFLDEMTSLVGVLDATLTDATRCAAVMVTNGQRLVQAETDRYLAELSRRAVRVGAIVSNNGDAAATGADVPHYRVPHLAEWPIGAAGLDRWLSALARA
jgi:arsenite/tail-anchored protein-transporting ATPase